MSNDKPIEDPLSEELTEALRQYRHNDSDAFVFGYDTDVTDSIVSRLNARVAELEQALQWIAKADWECEQEATDREVSHLKGECIHQMRYHARAALATRGG